MAPLLSYTAFLRSLRWGRGGSWRRYLARALPAGEVCGRGPRRVERIDRRHDNRRRRPVMSGREQTYSDRSVGGRSGQHHPVGRPFQSVIGAGIDEVAPILAILSPREKETDDWATSGPDPNLLLRRKVRTGTPARKSVGSGKSV